MQPNIIARIMPGMSLENPLAYCREKIAGPTSGLHYATLFQPEPQKAFWLGCFALNHELRQASMRQLEAGLTQVKLGWWRNALSQAQSNSNPHPVIQAMSAATVAGLGPDDWAMLIETTVQGCEVARFDTFAQWHAHTQALLQPWVQLLGVRMHQQGLLRNNTEQLLAFWASSGQLAQLLSLAKYLDEQFQPIPVTMLSQFGVQASQIKRREHDANTAALFEDVVSQIQNAAQKAWTAMPKEQRLFCRPLRALYRMRLAEWRVHKADGKRLLSEQKALTPWKKFSTAWTTHVLQW
ncbi:squalene/phytoene synthase family protein [Limnobacter sp.]|uniref:squalene/phytoene synthase family protein n=1 Tax=Limnobacter sp. TaxID=2003368 RepID=UPI003515C355